MNKKEIEIQIALGTYLQTKWNEYKKLSIATNNVHDIEKAYEFYTEAVKKIYGDNVIINWADGSVTNRRRL